MLHLLGSGVPESVGPRSLRIWAPGAARRSWASIGPTYGFAFRPNQCWALLGAWSCRETSPTLDRTLVSAPLRSIRDAGWSDICARVRAHPTQMPHAARRGGAASYSPS
eukprot:3379965-Prymnesium_polylepis.1